MLLIGILRVVGGKFPPRGQFFHLPGVGGLNRIAVCIFVVPLITVAGIRLVKSHLAGGYSGIDDGGLLVSREHLESQHGGRHLRYITGRVRSLGVVEMDHFRGGNPIVRTGADIHLVPAEGRLIPADVKGDGFPLRGDLDPHADGVAVGEDVVITLIDQLRFNDLQREAILVDPAPFEHPEEISPSLFTPVTHID